MVLLLYPSLCRVTLATFACIPVHLPDGSLSYRLFDDPSIECYATAHWRGWAAVACLGTLCYCVGAPLALLWLTYRHRNNPRGRKRVGMLLVSYTPECWYFESVEMLRKLLLSSVVIVVDPGSRVQLWFGLLCAVAFALLTATLQPYRDPVPGMIQTAALLQVLPHPNPGASPVKV